MGHLHKTVAQNLARYARSGTTQWLVQHADETCTIVVGSARDAENLRLTHAPRANVENIHTDIRFPGIEARNPAKFDPGIDNPTSLARIRGLILFDTDAIWALVREHEQLEVRAARAEAALNEAESRAARAEAALNEAESRAARAEAAARRAKERLAEVAAQLPAKNLRAWRVCQVSDDAQETISNPKHTPLLIAATPREAVESWFAQTNPPTTSTVRLYVSEYRDSPVELWRVHLAFLDGNWHGSVELA